MKSIKHYISTIIHHPTKVIWKLDKVFLGGRLKRLRNAKKEKKRMEEERFRIEHPEEWYDMMSNERRHKHPILGKQTISTRDILLAQYFDGYGDFYHIIIRLLAIEQFYGRNAIGYRLYERMQSWSGNFWLSRFIKLIESCENNGFDDRLSVELDSNMTLMDGAHRFALAIYSQIELLPSTILDTLRDERSFGSYNGLWEMNFSHEEIELIHQRGIKLFNECKYNYVGVIWPPAYDMRDEIIEEINSYLHVGLYPPLQNDDCKVVRFVDLKFSKLDFAGFLRAMYYTDMLNEDGIQWKLRYMENSLGEECLVYPVRVFYLDVLNPDIKRNPKNNSAQSRQISRIKKAIRNRFKDRVNKYEYDILMHISDNYIQSKFCELVVEMDKNVSGLFEQLNQRYEYVICKTEKRLSPEFPYYYYYSDADIIMKKEDLKGCADFIEKWLKKKYPKDWFYVDRISDIEREGIILKLRGMPIIYFDLQTTEHFGLSNAFNELCVKNRELSENKGYYNCPPPFDIIIRASEFVRNKNKVWHREYIKEHINNYSEELVEMAFTNKDDDLAKNVRQFFEDIRQNCK